MPKIITRNLQKDLSIEVNSVKKMVAEVLKIEGVATDEIAFYFVSSKKISRLHETFFEDPAVTDCITFPMENEKNAPYHVLGEVFVCPKAALEYDSTHPHRELTLYVVHGILHLLGYDDIDPAHRKIMRAKERQILTHLAQKQLFITSKKAPSRVSFNSC